MIIERPVRKVRGTAFAEESDRLVVEEPLEIRLGLIEAGRPVRRSISITMRTPGRDRELAVGFLFTEGILTSPSDVLSVAACAQPNTIRVDIADGVDLDLGRLQRHFYSSSSCGVCGKTSLESIAVSGLRPLGRSGPVVQSATLHSLPDHVRKTQTVFDRTGGIHAAALFDASGKLLSVFEDVGRHNAVDKLIGEQFLAGALPLSDHVLFLSGRASFELVQKALVAGIGCVAAVGAPSSLAVDLAERFEMTLVGFLREERFNVYCGEWRLQSGTPHGE